jgi:putative glutamine amidotransferase
MRSNNRPIIGITLSLADKSAEWRWPMPRAFDYLKRDYYKAIIDSGGLPVLLPNILDKETITEYLNLIDGILLTGGDDLNPEFIHQKPHKSIKRVPMEHDQFEFDILKGAIKYKIPILAGFECGFRR